MIGALGGEPDHLDEALTPSTTSTRDPQYQERRQAQIAALAAAFR